jgi:hypothetical protein
MRKKCNQFLDWFESKFNLIIDILALMGGAFCIFLSFFAFVALLFRWQSALDQLEFIILPGLIGFFGVIILFALRITRNLTKK